MTPQEINIEIAKVCGYRFDVYRDPEAWHPPPDYYHDLNAMHEAENWLLAGPLTDTLGMNYWNTLWVVAKDPYKTLRAIGNASAAQRAEAFLRTLNLWRS